MEPVSAALAFLMAGFALGMIATFGLTRAERSTPSPLPRRPRPASSSPSAPRVGGSPSNCRVVPASAPGTRDPLLGNTTDTKGRAPLFRDPPRKPDGSPYYLWDLEK